MSVTLAFAADLPQGHGDDAYLLKAPVHDFLAVCANGTAWPSNCTRTVNMAIAFTDHRPGTNVCVIYRPSDVADEASAERKLGDFTAEAVNWLRENPVPASFNAQDAVKAALVSLYPCKH